MSGKRFLRAVLGLACVVCCAGGGWAATVSPPAEGRAQTQGTPGFSREALVPRPEPPVSAEESPTPTQEVSGPSQALSAPTKEYWAGTDEAEGNAVAEPERIDAVREAKALGWGTDLDAELERARESHRPVVVMFVSGWAPPVAATVRETLPDAKVRQALRGVVAVALDVDANPDKAGEMKIDQLPTFVVLDSDGAEYDRFGGFMPPGAFVAAFEAAVDPKQSVPALVARTEKNPDDVAAHWLLAKKHARDKNAEGLSDALDAIRKADPENSQGYLDNVAYMELMTTLDPRMPADGLRGAERFLAEFPKSEFAPEVEIALAQIAYQMGNKDRAIRVLEDFPERYPRSPLAPQVAEDLRAIRVGK